ncbi:hypothetical protein SISSUDRAFT_266473 [Sistotremastrum suecicum HHB10207 ss-3]|uniref:Uncharacterized protein n=1 Tax=Sistotremastrum suecicum HHB10207 ss-3 TaxID=1314776 RepID=A0A166GFJ2_9AGAM|nr:hypothetical protein SISSUDRAFT_266473 [Sistotremastrum suecicum HHB10207 ss-3]
MPSTPVVVLPHVSAECTKNSVWQHLNGTNGKGPCEIANGLRSHKGKKCTSMAHPYDLAGNDPSVSPPYTGPSAHEATPCACSYEMYNAFSACAACQSEMGHNSTVMASWVS